jgi:four helix bundle protein
MTNEEFNEMFRGRTKEFALAVIKFLETIPFNSATRVMSFQLCKAATSIGANFSAFCRGRSRNERFAKICIVVEEADEAIYWLDLFAGATYGDQDLLSALSSEGLEILKITTKIKHSSAQ